MRSRGEHERNSGARPTRPAAAPPERAAAGAASGVLALQRAAGNHAASAMLRAQPALALQPTAGNRAALAVLRPQHALQRFTEAGHKAIGDAAAGGGKLTLGPGLQVTYGDAVAAGDYFGSFEEMQKLAQTAGKGAGTQGEVRYVLIRHIWARPKGEGLGSAYDERAAFFAEQRSRKLDSYNIPHFPNPLEGDPGRATQQKTRRQADHHPLGALASYRTGHELAMRDAYANGAHHRPNDDALLADGFACHFLTDSFSAGHVRTARASIKEYWDRKVPNFQQRLVNWLVDRIDAAHWGWYRRAGAPIVRGGRIRNVARLQLNTALSGANYSFGTVVGLIVHDTEGEHGVEAKVGRRQVRLVGDTDLVDDKGKVTAKGQVTFDLAVEAVKASIADVRRAYDAGTKGENLETVMTDLSPNGLYGAEQQIPRPVDDAALPEKDRSFPWKADTVEDLLTSAQMTSALMSWGPHMAKEFGKRLDDIDDLPPIARDAIRHALLDPLASGDEDQIRQVLLSIAAHN